MQSNKHRWGSLGNAGIYTTDIRIDTFFFRSNLCLTVFCHITVVCCHFIVDYIAGDLFKCKNKPSEMALISVSRYFKVIFESVNFQSPRWRVNCIAQWEFYTMECTIFAKYGLNKFDSINFSCQEIEPSLCLEQINKNNSLCD